MPSTKRALLVGSSGALGPIWKLALEDLQLDVLTADLSYTDADFSLNLLDPVSISQMLEDLPKLDTVVLNASIDSKPVPGFSASDSHFEQSEWTNFFQVNVVGYAQLIQGIIPKLNDGAGVIAIGSMYGLVAPRAQVYNLGNEETPFVKHLAYGASKAALVNLIKQFASIYAGLASFNLLTLGVVEGEQTQVFRDKMPPHIPTGSFISRTDLGKYLQGLVTMSDIDFTGHNLVVDGGYTLW